MKKIYESKNCIYCKICQVCKYRVCFLANFNYFMIFGSQFTILILRAIRFMLAVLNDTYSTETKHSIVENVVVTWFKPYLCIPLIKTQKATLIRDGLLWSSFSVLTSSPTFHIIMMTYFISIWISPFGILKEEAIEGLFQTHHGCVIDLLMNKNFNLLILSNAHSFKFQCTL